MKEKNSFIMLKEWREQLDFLTEKQQAELLRMIFDYQCDGEVSKSRSAVVNSIFLTMRMFFDSSNEKYADICKKRSEAGKHGAEIKQKNKQNQAKQANADFAYKQTSKTSLSESESEYEYEYDSEYESDKLNNKAGVNNKAGNVKEKEKRESDADAPARSRFSPPAVEEVSDYVHQNSLNVDPEAFVDYYKSNDWYVGKHKMHDWKAAARNWHRREEQNGPHGTVQKSTADDVLLKIIAEGG